MTDLNDAIDRTLGIRLYDARGINDRGQIVANGVLDSAPFSSHAILLTPVPEPSTLLLLTISSLDS
jgi:hypothetical protein